MSKDDPKWPPAAPKGMSEERWKQLLSGTVPSGPNLGRRGIDEMVAEALGRPDNSPSPPIIIDRIRPCLLRINSCGLKLETALLGLEIAVIRYPSNRIIPQGAKRTNVN